MYVHAGPDADTVFIPRQEELNELNRELAPMLTSEQDDKQYRLVMEYATVSGAGKTRWMFNAFKRWEYGSLKASVVHINFNGADNSTDCLYVQGAHVTPEAAIARLLLSRGVFECSADLTWIMDFPLHDKVLPPLQVVLDALFEARFGVAGSGLLVIHLDEFVLLRTARLQYNAESACIVDVDAWIKTFLQVLCS
jgi:hypothetical protein